MSTQYLELIPNGISSYHVNYVYGNSESYIGDFYCETDGYYVWEPSGRKGYCRAEFLQLIANKLNELNSGWDKNLDEYFNSIKQTESI